MLLIRHVCISHGLLLIALLLPLTCAARSNAPPRPRAGLQKRPSTLIEPKDEPLSVSSRSNALGKKRDTVLSPAAPLRIRTRTQRKLARRSIPSDVPSPLLCGSVSITSTFTLRVISTTENLDGTSSYLGRYFARRDIFAERAALTANTADRGMAAVLRFTRDCNLQFISDNRIASFTPNVDVVTFLQVTPDSNARYTCSVAPPSEDPMSSMGILTCTSVPSGVPRLRTFDGTLVNGLSTGANAAGVVIALDVL